MAGTKGKSGGARMNSGGARANSGGARDGAGRPPKTPQTLEIPPHEDPLKFLATVMNTNESDAKLRVEAAKALLPYTHARGPATKREIAKDAAERASTGKYAVRPGPRLVANNRDVKK